MRSHGEIHAWVGIKRGVCEVDAVQKGPLSEFFDETPGWDCCSCLDMRYLSALVSLAWSLSKIEREQA